MTQTVSFFPVVHSVLDPAALLHEIAVHYDIPLPSECVLLRSWINEVYQVRTSGEQFILKVFRHGWRAPGEVAYEAELMQHLARCNLRVQPPVPMRNGMTFHLVSAPEGQRPIVLYPMLVGGPPLPPSDDVYHRVGRALAQMHQALDSFVPTYPRRLLDFDYLDTGGEPL